MFDTFTFLSVDFVYTHYTRMWCMQAARFYLLSETEFRLSIYLYAQLMHTLTHNTRQCLNAKASNYPYPNHDSLCAQQNIYTSWYSSSLSACFAICLATASWLCGFCLTQLPRTYTLFSLIHPLIIKFVQLFPFQAIQFFSHIQSHDFEDKWKRTRIACVSPVPVEASVYLKFCH